MDQSPNLNLPYLAEAQAQKHVTVNSGLRQLDVLVQTLVVSRSATAPQGLAAQNGDAHIVPDGATGVWTGWDRSVAAFQDGAWAAFPPRAGWIVHIRDEDLTVIFDGQDWRALARTEDSPFFGINATADATNRLVVKSDAVLHSHDDVTPGSGDVRHALNKSGPAATGSFLFQTGYSARAEFGLLQDDDFTLRVTPDGVTYHDALVVERTTGAVSLPSTPALGSAARPAADFHIESLHTDAERVLHFAGIASFYLGQNAGHPANTGESNIGIGVRALGQITSGAFNVAVGTDTMASLTTGRSNLGAGRNALADLTSGSGNVGLGASALADLVSGTDNIAIGNLGLQRSTGSQNVAIGAAAAREASDAAGGVYIGWRVAESLTTGTNNILIGARCGSGLDTGSGNVMLGQASPLTPGMNETVLIHTGTGQRRLTIDESGQTAFEGTVKTRTYSVSELTATFAAQVGAGALAYCDDESGGPVPVFSDGAVWRRMTDRATVS